VKTCLFLEEDNLFWIRMHTDYSRSLSSGRDCFTMPLLDDIAKCRASVKEKSLDIVSRGKVPFVVLASSSDMFNQGGDLSFFVKSIREQNRDILLSYALTCVSGIHEFYTGLGGTARSIALVQGSALGGGFEAALSCQTIVAERGVDMGLPEVLFNLFPGMGAFSFLRQRVSMNKAEEIILSGKIYKSDELFDLGVVDYLVDKGEGEECVQKIVARANKINKAVMAMNKVRSLATVTHDELKHVTEVWVDTALSLDEKSLKMMMRLSSAQTKRGQAGVSAVPTTGLSLEAEKEHLEKTLEREPSEQTNTEDLGDVPFAILA